MAAKAGRAPGPIPTDARKRRTKSDLHRRFRVRRFMVPPLLDHGGVDEDGLQGPAPVEQPHLCPGGDLREGELLPGRILDRYAGEVNALPVQEEMAAGNGSDDPTDHLEVAR